MAIRDVRVRTIWNYRKLLNLICVGGPVVKNGACAWSFRCAPKCACRTPKCALLEDKCERRSPPPSNRCLGLSGEHRANQQAPPPEPLISQAISTWTLSLHQNPDAPPNNLTGSRLIPLTSGSGQQRTGEAATLSPGCGDTSPARFPQCRRPQRQDLGCFHQEPVAFVENRNIDVHWTYRDRIPGRPF